MSMRGMTLIEVLIGGAILAVGMTVSMMAVTTFNRQINHSSASVDKDYMALTLADTLANEVNQYQVGFKYKDPVQAFSQFDNQTLPIAWTKDTMVDASECPTCAGRMGFIVNPLGSAAIRGLFLVTVRTTNTLINEGKPTDFQWIYSGR